MKKLPFIQLFFSFLLLVFMLGCDKDENTGVNCIDDNPRFVPENFSEPGSYTADFYPGNEIDLYEEGELTSAMWKPGNKTVFVATYRHDPEPMMIDDEIHWEIWFEVDQDLEEFLISGDDLEKANAQFANLCFCRPAGFFSVTSGCIKGEKISDTQWQVDINIVTRKEDATFVKMLSMIFTN